MNRFFIISGGDWDGLWEIVVRAKSAKSALNSYKRHNQAIRRLAENEQKNNIIRINKTLKKEGKPFVQYEQRQYKLEEVDICTASFNKNGVLVSG